MTRKGVLATVAAYVSWGLLPIYWKSVQSVSAFEVLCHRTVWSLAFVILLLVLRRQWTWLQRIREQPTVAAMFIGTACILGLNWFVYIWAVKVGRILDASLGYFINPLLSVLLGVLFLKEQLRVWQWMAIGLAGCGVVVLTLGYGAFPWVALTLAVTFGFYGLLRKTASLGSLEGLALETFVLSIPAAAYLVYLGGVGQGAFGHAGTATTILLALTGVVTALPLLMFAYGARRVALSTVGILQYVTPTLQFLLGVFVYGEDFSRARLVGFGAIWMALLMYSLEGVFERRRKRERERAVIGSASS